MNAIILKNDFHETTVTLRPAADSTISVRAFRAAMRKLCGMSDCKCGGIRGRQSVEIGTNYGPDGIINYYVAR